MAGRREECCQVRRIGLSRQDDLAGIQGKNLIKKLKVSRIEVEKEALGPE